MWHVETFNSRGQPGEMEDLLRHALVYWRSRGFNVRVYVRQYSLGDKQFWLLTELNRMADLEGWPAMATSEAEGQSIMNALLQPADGMTASVVAELEAEA